MRQPSYLFWSARGFTASGYKAGQCSHADYPPPSRHPPKNGLDSLPYPPSATHSRAGLPPRPVDLLHFSSGATNPSLCNTLR